MTKGITLVAVGNYGYLQWANNMAVSLRYHSPQVPIQLITSKKLEPDAHVLGLYNIITVLPDEDFTDCDGRLFPAKLKTALYHHLVFDETIYLDVDGCIIRDITPLFETKSDFAADVQGVYDLTQGEYFHAMKWARPDVTWFHFGLRPFDRLPAINSSFLFLRRSDLCEALYEKAYELLLTNPLRIENHMNVWGIKRKTKNQQPDELYMNVALAMLKIPVQHISAIHFRLRTETGDYLPIEKISENYYGIGLFGELRSNHLSLQQHYNQQMKKMWKAVTGTTFYNKCELLANSKFAVL